MGLGIVVKNDPFQIPFPSYQPPSYTSPELRTPTDDPTKRQFWADKDSEHSGLRYNEMDKIERKARTDNKEEDSIKTVDRRSYLGKYDVVDGYPR